MMSQLLTTLSDAEFSTTVGLLPNPAAVRRSLRSPQITEIRKALTSGQLTEEAIREFVNAKMHDIRPGQRFVHEPAIAAICVALEAIASHFADEFTNDLAKLEFAEMPTAIRIARLSHDERQRLKLWQSTGMAVETHERPQTPIREGRS